ncbi:PREDICTED: uncharacterized protein LOC104600221 [Nelumbo nucifera]|uniref:Uncharacterized protein LOC104600221 n=1 Tax=Nelumbo nucifera TaxID=4432 RepID=A0A1U8AH50_NELNU|nr:PREDICTED: uncharacterized protein LOC104600221 [Nelumbo nucifera]
MSDESGFGKTICSICYEDFKPIVEDLQAISTCGHVFHELCLQQWFEYCSKAKKSTCPVCKQCCSPENALRLYFQWIGDSADLIRSQKPFLGEEEDPAALRREVKRLEGKISGLGSAFERQQRDLKDLSEELCLCKDNLKKELELKKEALKQKVVIQQLLHSKSEELEKLSLECSRLQERNVGLAKELAALKLVSDVNLEEEEVLKLASFGNGTNTKDTIDVLKKSLVLRNKSYKELMAQCNLLGRGENRSLRKLEKAEEKIKKLKSRVQELETALEEKDNEALRALKASKKTTTKGVDTNDLNRNPNSPCINNSPSASQLVHPVKSIKNSNQSGHLNNDTFHSRKMDHSKFGKDLGVNTSKQDATVILDPDNDDYSVIDKDGHLFGFSDSSIATKNYINKTSAGVLAKDVKLLVDDTTDASPLINIRKETPSSVPITQPGDQCFSGGLIGPDGTKRYLGKWCKRVHSKAPEQQSGCGSLIAVGADGRGGRIKVLRSQNQSFLDDKGNTMLPKRLKSSAQQSQGCLQIEHFFRKVA